MTPLAPPWSPSALQTTTKMTPLAPPWSAQVIQTEWGTLWLNPHVKLWVNPNVNSSSPVS